MSVVRCGLHKPASSFLSAWLRCVEEVATEKPEFAAEPSDACVRDRYTNGPTDEVDGVLGHYLEVIVPSSELCNVTDTGRRVREHVFLGCAPNAHVLDNLKVIHAVENSRPDSSALGHEALSHIDAGE